MSSPQSVSDSYCLLPSSYIPSPISHAYYLYNIHTGLYMLQPWEKAMFNTCAFFALSMFAVYSAFFFEGVRKAIKGEDVGDVRT